MTAPGGGLAAPVGAPRRMEPFTLPAGRGDMVGQTPRPACWRTRGLHKALGAVPFRG